jgi:hypothetical protein
MYVIVIVCIYCLHLIAILKRHSIAAVQQTEKDEDDDDDDEIEGAKRDELIEAGLISPKNEEKLTGVCVCVNIIQVYVVIQDLQMKCVY